MPLTEMTLGAAFRAAMPIAGRWAYFDHAAVAPLPQCTHDAIIRWADEATKSGDTVWPGWSRGVEETRRRAAQLIAAEPTEIALVPNTTTGISLVAEGFPWQPGDNMVTLDNEFPSNAYPWMNLASRGVECRRVATAQGRVDLQRIADACDRRTRLVSISWVGYASGWRVNLADLVQLARDRGVQLFVDAIQGLGALPLDVRQTPIDFLAADGHKWLLGPEGAGILYIRRDRLEMLRPLGVGWHSVAHAGDFARLDLTLRDDAARYEGGTQNMVGHLGLGASLQLLMELRIDAIERRVVSAADTIAQRVQSLGGELATERVPGHGSGIVSFSLPGEDPVAVQRRCLQRGVVVACRAGRLRVSPHGYVSEDDIERLLEALVAK